MTTIQSVLVATDFSLAAEAATRRAASIVSEARLRGAAVHVIPGTLPADMHMQATAQAHQALSVLGEELKRSGLAFEKQLLFGDVSAELARVSSGYDLIVAGARGQDVLTHFFLGRTSSRLVRVGSKPTLIVKRPPEGPYRRVVAAADFSEPSRDAVVVGARIAPKADFDFVHAFEVEFESSLRLASAAEETVQIYRRQARDKALTAMDTFTSRVPLPHERICRTVSRGYPPKVIVDRAVEMDAELIVMGKHAAGVVERAFIGSVSAQVLQRAECDVLIVPEQVA